MGGISEEEYCKKNPSDLFGGVQGCEKYHKGDGGKGCCKANTADCLACSEARALRGSARRRGTVMSKVARSTTGGAAGARTTGMTAASKGTGASEIGLADDLGSMSTVPFGCLL